MMNPSTIGRWLGTLLVALVSSELAFLATFSLASVLHGVSTQDLVLGAWILAIAWLPPILLALYLVWVLLVKRGHAMSFLEATILGGVIGVAITVVSLFTRIL